MNLRRRLRNALLALLIVAAISVSGYCLLGGRDVTFLQALYMTVITLSTVGYGEVVDTSHNPLLRIFNIFVLLFGVAIMIYVISVVTAFLVEGQLSDLFRRRKMEKQISTLTGHYIICGLGDTGRHVAEELQTTGTPFVMIESNEEVARKFCEERHDLLYIIGDATDEAVLDHAGVGRARGLIAGLPADKDNLVITFLVRQKNPAIRIVARCTDEAKFSARMVKAGANSTVSPNRIGGLRLASEVIRPDVVEFLDLMLKEHSHTLRVEQIEIPEGSSWSGVSLDDLNLRTRYQLMPLALKNCGARQSAGSAFQVNPPGEQVLRDGGIVIVLGDVNDVKRAREESHLRRAA
ncbi:MAG TPA: potassium channel protein [Terriglobales bacterium]|jgi:voltage-gated potassium channel|nr:potassium channel protein [Terriglobales bacterium]